MITGVVKMWTSSRTLRHHRTLSVCRCLNRIELRVLPAPGHQLFVRSDFGDARAVEDDDEIGHAHGAEAV